MSEEELSLWEKERPFGQCSFKTANDCQETLRNGVIAGYCGPSGGGKPYCHGTERTRRIGELTLTESWATLLCK